MFWFRFTPKQDKIFVCASGTCSIRRVAGATSGSPAAAASRSADSGSHCSVPYQQLYKNTKSVRASSTPSQPQQVLSRWMLLFLCGQGASPAPPQQQIVSGTCSFCWQGRKWHLTCFELEWLHISPKTVCLYIERDLIQNWYNSGLISMTFTTGDKLQTEDRGR